MSKRRGATAENVVDWIKKGHGQGAGKYYRPFLLVRDVPSFGRSSMVLGLKTGRVHNYFSDVEYFHHVIFEYNPFVKDIREQYALLPWEETQEIADKLRIRHPVYPGTKTPIVMTTDIVVTLEQYGEIKNAAISIKHSAALKVKEKKLQRLYEKLLIEKVYWARRGVSWCLSTEQHISLNRAKNLDLLRTSQIAKELDWLMPYLWEFIERFNFHWPKCSMLLEILKAVSKDMNLSVYYCHMLFGRAVWLRHLPVDLDSEIIRHHYPLRRKAIEETEPLCLALA